MKIMMAPAKIKIAIAAPQKSISQPYRQMKLGHGTVSPDEGKKKTELPSPSHHPRILSIRPRSARRHPAFLVRRIDLANNFAITPLQSHPSEIRRSALLAGLRAVCATFPDPRKGRSGNIA